MSHEEALLNLERTIRTLQPNDITAVQQLAEAMLKKQFKKFCQLCGQKLRSRK